MDDRLPVFYLGFFLLILGVAAWFVLRQVLQTRKTENTLGKLQSKLAKESGTAQEYYEYASILLDKKLFVQGIKQLQKALKLSETEPSENLALIYNGLGFAYAAQEQYDLAIRNYKEALKLQPKYTIALNNLGFAYERKKLSTQALETYDTLLQLEPDNVTAKRRAESLRKRIAV
jgi:tetratricopeptide (TPR) repeat protein